MDEDAAKFFERAARAFVGDRADVSLANREGGDTTGGFLADAFGSAARAFAEELTRAADAGASGGGRARGVDGDGDASTTPRLAK